MLPVIDCQQCGIKATKEAEGERTQEERGALLTLLAEQQRERREEKMACEVVVGCWLVLFFLQSRKNNNAKFSLIYNIYNIIDYISTSPQS